MRVPSRPTWIRRMLESRLKQLGPTRPVLPASLNRVHKRCGRPSCSCHKGGPLHQAHHLTVSEAGRTRTVYVPQDLLADVQRWVNEYRRLKTLIQEISQLTLALVRGHARHRPLRRGRR